MVIKNGNVFLKDSCFHKTDIKISNDEISQIGRCTDNQIIDAEGLFVVPGLFDIHIHGAMNSDFSDGNRDATTEISQYLFSKGVTNFLGTTMALPFGDLAQIFSANKDDVGVHKDNHSTLIGINMEGPFFSKDKKGAQNEKNLIIPNVDFFEKLFDISNHSIKLCDFAPELDGSHEFISKISSLCKLSIAHTCADYETAKKAFSCGVDHVTHLYNGMPTFTHREPSVVGAAFDSNAFVEVICDGVHVHPSVIRATFDLFGDDRVCLISDSMRACGMPNGEYDLGGLNVIVKDGCARISSGSLAGSITCLADCVRNAVSFGVPLESAIKAATITPARSVGVEQSVGIIDVGKFADMILLDSHLKLKHVIQGGKVF